MVNKNGGEDKGYGYDHRQEKREFQMNIPPMYESKTFIGLALRSPVGSINFAYLI